MGKKHSGKIDNHMSIPLLSDAQARELVKALQEQQKLEGKNNG